MLPHSIAAAAHKSELEPVVEWLQRGGHIDALDENSYGLLHVAAGGGHLRMARELLKRGASVDLRCNDEGTGIIAAAVMGQHAMVCLLLEHKANTNLQNAEGVTALMAAAYRGNKECVQELLAAGASTELRDKYGCTALRAAEARGQAASVELLRRHAATPPATAATPTPNLSGRRVRIDGLKARPELNGRCGVAGCFDATKSRYEVAVEGEAEAVLLRPASLQDVGTASAATEPATLPQDVVLATRNGDLQQAVEWLQKGGHVDSLAENGYGLLHVAVSNRQLRMAKELLQRGASVDLRGAGHITALIVAAAGREHRRASR